MTVFPVIIASEAKQSLRILSSLRALPQAGRSNLSDGHPDKTCDQIADAVLDACVAQDSDNSVNVLTMTQ